MGQHGKILVLDFDGVIHSYTSGWKGVDCIPDPPVDGAFEFIASALEHFDVAIYSSRSKSADGRKAMQTWFRRYQLPVDVFNLLQFPTTKPPAWITIDDREDRRGGGGGRGRY